MWFIQKFYEYSVLFQKLHSIATPEDPSIQLNIRDEINQTQ